VRITYDGEADALYIAFDALYIAFGEGPATVQEVAEGIALDWDSEGRLLGIEILDASKRLADPEALRRFALEALPVLR
jgi:YD repeat-containing protein